MSETPTTTTSQKVSQYASHLYRSTFVPLGSKEREILSVLLPFVSQYASHLYCNTPPICIAVLLGKSWWLWSPDCSPEKARVRVFGKDKVLRRVLRRERFIEGA